MTELNYLLVSCTLFLLGIWGIFLNRKNIVIVLMSIELMLLVGTIFLFSVYLDDLMGQIFLFNGSSCESSIGLAFLLSIIENNKPLLLNLLIF